MAEHPVRGLYAITDPALIPARRLGDAVGAALAGGARLVQYRDKPASAAERYRRATLLTELCTAHGARLLVNDDVELAIRAGAHGVHLGQADGDVRRARDQLGPHALIGVTCHGDLALARAAIADGASYVAFGRFFASVTKPLAPPASPDILGHDLAVPKVAIGGITPDNAPQLIRAGASALAVIHALFASDDIEATARRFARLFPEDS